MNDAVRIMAMLTARPGKAAALRALLDGMIAPSRAETGNLRYDLWVDRATPDRLVLDELYTDQGAVDAHRATRHFQNYLSQIDELAERIVLTLGPVAVA
ncbi:MAG TPA: putative quinol monooxygenase [Acidisoma sp.]|uniref:putative quinol monooxygenase n=1 Tax=Acidisoma sp. TaxID=1872115 RepID=UPI002C87BD0D|nr:putative quinol monooxygenase [Acidisoma sp.]HTH99780.1 putative quinol monooxygenase [Acidisoma sp.]